MFFCVSFSSVFLFLFLVPSASKILRDLRVKFTVTVFSKKHHTGSNLLQFVIPDILLPLFIRTSTIILIYYDIRFCFGFTNFNFAVFEQFLFIFVFFSSPIFAISSQFLCNLAICMYMLIGNKEKRKQGELKRELKKMIRKICGVFQKCKFIFPYFCFCFYSSILMCCLCLGAFLSFFLYSNHKCKIYNNNICFRTVRIFCIIFYNL